MERQTWIELTQGLPIVRQCELASVARATVYAQRGRAEQAVDEQELLLLKLLDEEYTRRPIYGSRRMKIYLLNQGHIVNRKHVQRLMQLLGLCGMAPGPNTSVRHPQHKVYPYLLRGMVITKPNQVWSTDITYIRLARGFVYLVAVIDWYSRKVLSWQLSNTLDAGFCIECLERALAQFGKPEIFNTDQGVQFTSDGFISVLKTREIRISMDGRGRALDNIFVERLWRSVKYEEVYLKDYADVSELLQGLTEYFVFYNGERPHQSLNYATPDKVYKEAVGGGACIVDKYTLVDKNGSVELQEAA